jgi:hypothetical protein
MHLTDPRESGPLLLVTGLYVAVIEVGFHVDAPALAPTSLLIVALSLIILGHLLNLYQVAKVGNYPTSAYAIEFLLLGTVAWMFKTLAHPVFGAAGKFLSLQPWEYGPAMSDVMWRGEVVSQDQYHQLIRLAFQRVFALSLPMVVLLTAWHEVVKRHNEDKVWLKGEALYRIGWIVVLAFAGWGLWLTRSEVVSEDTYRTFIGSVEALAALAVLLSAVFLILAKHVDATYQAWPHEASGEAMKQDRPRLNAPKWLVRLPELVFKSFLFNLYCHLICYRFKRFVNEELTLPKAHKNLTVGDVQLKARSSLTTVGVIFLLTVALVGTPFVSEEIRKRLDEALGQLKEVALYVGGGVLLPYLAIWAERNVSTLKMDSGEREPRAVRYAFLFFMLLVAFAFFLWIDRIVPVSERLLGSAFSVSGLFLTLVAVFLLLLSLEFYDSASGWRGETGGESYFFHLASIASHSYSFGLSLTLVAVALLLSVLSVTIGRVVVCITLLAVVSVLEFERILWDRRAPRSTVRLRNGLP